MNWQITQNEHVEATAAARLHRRLVCRGREQAEAEECSVVLITHRWLGKDCLAMRAQLAHDRGLQNGSSAWAGFHASDSTPLGDCLANAASLPERGDVVLFSSLRCENTRPSAVLLLWGAQPDLATRVFKVPGGWVCGRVIRWRCGERSRTMVRALKTLSSGMKLAPDVRVPGCNTLKLSDNCERALNCTSFVVRDHSRGEGTEVLEAIRRDGPSNTLRKKFVAQIAGNSHRSESIQIRSKLGQA